MAGGAGGTTKRKTTAARKKSPTMTVAAMEAVATAAADKAVRDVLLAIGIDAQDQLATQRTFAALREVAALYEDQKFQADLMYLRAWRENLGAVKTKGLLLAFSLVMTGLAALLVTGFKGWMRANAG